MNPRQSSNLLFLLSLPLLGAGCPGDDAASDTGGSTSTAGDGTTAGVDTTSGVGSTGASGQTATGGGSSGEPPGTSTGVATTSGSDGSTGMAGTGGQFMCDGMVFPYDVGPISDGCTAYADQLNLCFEGGALSPECLEYEAAVCQFMVDFDVMNAGPDCATAYDDLYACLSALTCREFMGADPCPPEVTAWMQACFGA